MGNLPENEANTEKTEPRDEDRLLIASFVNLDQAIPEGLSWIFQLHKFKNTCLVQLENCIAIVTYNDRILPDLSLFPHLGFESGHECSQWLSLLEKWMWPPPISVLRKQG